MEEEYVFMRKVYKINQNSYGVTIPKQLGKILHGKIVQIRLRIIALPKEVSENG